MSHRRDRVGKYDRDRVAGLFDDDEYRRSFERPDGAEGIIGYVGRVCLERLELAEEDVLLDVGSGTGDNVIAAGSRCRLAIGIDISLRSLEVARTKAGERGLDNVSFHLGSFEDPSAEADLSSMGITKILSVYALHHLPDGLKRQGLQNLSKFLRRPGRLVIGDIIFFEDPGKHRDVWDSVLYDDGDVDFPSRSEFLVGVMEDLGGEVVIESMNPLVGVITADFF